MSPTTRNSMISQTFLFILCLFLLVNNVWSISITKRGHEVFKVLKEAKEKVKHGTQCLPPSKYFAGSCYSYMNMLPATSWERAHNNCRLLPTTRDAHLLVIDSIAEYEFVHRDLIGPKSGSDSVSVYVGLRKINDTWLWSNETPLKETPIYRYWVDNNKDILAFDCGVLWLARNTSVLTAAACAEQALRPYVCKHTIDRCYNNSGVCGKYGTCLNLPLVNSYRCQCRFLYSGERCEKWSSQGFQAIAGTVIVVIALITSYFISLDRSGDPWSYQKSTTEHYQSMSVYSQSRPTSYMPRTPTTADRVIFNPCLPPHPDFLDASSPSEKRRWQRSPPMSPEPIVREIHPIMDRKNRYSFRLSVQELQVTNHIRNFFFKPQKIMLISLPIIFTLAMSIFMFFARRSVKRSISDGSFSNSTRLFQFCALYENQYYINLVTLPIAAMIIIIIIANQTRRKYSRSRKSKNSKGFSIYTPIPFNPFSKVNRFETMALCGIISHEILQIIEEIFLNGTQLKILTMRGPLFDLVRQIGLVIIIGLRYYPVYAVVDMSEANLLYYGLCALYMWIDLTFRLIEQSYCFHIRPIFKTWQKFQQLKSNLTSKLTSNSWMASTMVTPHDFDGTRSTSIFRNFPQRLSDSLVSRRMKTSSTIAPVAALQSNLNLDLSPDGLNWQSIYSNFSASITHNESQSTFDQFNIDSSVIGIIKYVPYYLCLSYICFHLTYLFITNVYDLIICCQQDQDELKKKPQKHIYQEPDLSSTQKLSVEYRYVRHLFQKTKRILINSDTKVTFIKSLLYKIYRPNKYFSYSKQILNMYMIAFMLTYYLMFNILEGGFYIIEKVYGILVIPIIILFDELDLPQPKPSNLKYEMIIACLMTAIIYYGQLLWGMKNYQKHMLDAYKGVFIDIPPRTAFKDAKLISHNAHYAGYCIAYLGFGYITLGNVVFFIVVILRVIFKHIFLLEAIAEVLIPISVIYLTKLILMWFLSRTFFLQRHGKTMALKNLRGFFVFTYFNFFFDCFLGIISCALRVSKASLAALIFLPRLDYCIFGRTLEKVDTGFTSYVSFIHMECLHTHPVLIFFCSLIQERIERRYQYLRSNKREMRQTEMYAFTRRQRARFRWWLAFTLSRNTQLVQLRRHQLILFQLPEAESFNEFLGRKVFNRFQTLSNRNAHEKSDTNAQTSMNQSSGFFRNPTTACTTLLLGADDHDERFPPITKNLS